MKNLIKRFDNFDKNWRLNLEKGPLTNQRKRSAIRHSFWMDHECLRQFYHNAHEISKDVFRSNQPSPERIRDWYDKGIKTIINFRGVSNQGAYLLEKEVCENLGVELINYKLFATKLPPQKSILDLEEVFKKIRKPVLMHCKSGSDRAGLGAALYFIYILKSPIEDAQKQLSFKFLHIGGWSAGILDYMLMRYRQEFENTGISFKDWVKNIYEPVQLTIDFKIFRKNNRWLKIPR